MTMVQVIIITNSHESFVFEFTYCHAAKDGHHASSSRHDRRDEGKSEWNVQLEARMEVECPQ
jgi:hypothetical protein